MFSFSYSILSLGFTSTHSFFLDFVSYNSVAYFKWINTSRKIVVFNILGNFGCLDSMVCSWVFLCKLTIASIPAVFHIGSHRVLKLLLGVQVSTLNSSLKCTEHESPLHNIFILTIFVLQNLLFVGLRRSHLCNFVWHVFASGWVVDSVLVTKVATCYEMILLLPSGVSFNLFVYYFFVNLSLMRRINIEWFRFSVRHTNFLFVKYNL